MRKGFVALTLALFLVVSVVSPALGNSPVSRMNGVAVTRDGDLVGRASLDGLTLTLEGQNRIASGVLRIAGDSFEIEAQFDKSDGTSFLGSGHALDKKSGKRIGISLGVLSER